MKTLPFVVAIVVASSSIAAGAGQVEDADEAKVAGCTFIQDVSAPTSTGNYTRSALGNAMEVARAEAAKAGATHIVWNKIKNNDVSSVSGKAYRCPK